MKNEITPHPSNDLCQVLKRGYEDRLVIDETTYDHQGDYVCEAINAIGGQRKIVQSDPIHIEVRGRPKAIHACGRADGRVAAGSKPAKLACVVGR